MPLPWCTSQSRISTRATPSSACSARAATATLLKRQKPIARSRLGVVAGRAHRGEARLRLAARDGAREVDQPAGGELGDLEAARAEVGVGIELDGRARRGGAQRRAGAAACARAAARRSSAARARRAPAARGARRARSRRRRGARAAPGVPAGPRARGSAGPRARPCGGCRTRRLILSERFPPRKGRGLVRVPRSIAITGLRSFVGKRMLRRVREAEPEVQLHGIDLQRPYGLDPAVRFHALDLAEPTADGRLAELLQKEGVEAVLHAAFRSQPRADLEADHEFETIGSLHLLHACAAARVRRLVVASSTMVYGARPDNPNFLSEDHPLRGHPAAHNVRNRVEVEELVATWRARHRDVEVTVLRPCWLMGPSYQDCGHELLRARGGADADGLRPAAPVRARGRLPARLRDGAPRRAPRRLQRRGPRRAAALDAAPHGRQAAAADPARRCSTASATIPPRRRPATRPPASTTTCAISGSPTESAAGPPSASPSTRPSRPGCPSCPRAACGATGEGADGSQRAAAGPDARRSLGRPRRPAARAAPAPRRGGGGGLRARLVGRPVRALRQAAPDGEHLRHGGALGRGRRVRPRPGRLRARAQRARVALRALVARRGVGPRRAAARSSPCSSSRTTPGCFPTTAW